MTETIKGSWLATATADNAVATATRPAPAGGARHFITGIAGSFSVANAGKLLELRAGAVNIGNWYVAGPVSLEFFSPIEMPPATVANLVLAASGTGGQVAAITLKGYTLCKMATLLSTEWVNGRLEKTWAHIGEDGRKKITVEVVQDVEPAMDHAKVAAQNVNRDSFLRFKANVSGVQLEDACRIECKLWGVRFHECFSEVMQGKTDRAKKIWALLTEGRDFAKLQARYYK